MHVAMKYQQAGKTKPGHRVKMVLHCFTGTVRLCGRLKSFKAWSWEPEEISLWEKLLEIRIAVRMVLLRIKVSLVCWVCAYSMITKQKVINAVLLNSKTLSVWSIAVCIPNITLLNRLLVHMTVPLPLFFKFFGYYIVLYCGRVLAANAPGCTAAEGLLYKPWSLAVPTCTARCLHQRP